MAAATKWSPESRLKGFDRSAFLDRYPRLHLHSPQNGIFSELRFTFPRRFLLFPTRALPDLWLQLKPGSSPEHTSTPPDPVEAAQAHEERRQLSGQQLSAEGWMSGTSVRPQQGIVNLVRLARLKISNYYLYTKGCANPASGEILAQPTETSG